MAIHVLEEYLSVEEYAKLCGKQRRVIMDRIKAKAIRAIKVDGYLAINKVSNPPRSFIHASKKPLGGGVHISHKELSCVTTWCHGKGIRSYPYLRAIITGKLDGWVIGDEVFAKTFDLDSFRKRRS